MLRYQCVDRRDTGDVDDGDLGTRGDDLFEQAFHDGLGARAVEGPDQRQGENASHNRTTGVDRSSSVAAAILIKRTTSTTLGCQKVTAWLHLQRVCSGAHL